MKLGIINSAFGQAGVDTKTGLEHIARIGFDVVDVFTEAMTITEEEIVSIENTCAENNLPIVSLPIISAGLIDFNDPVRDFHLERGKKFIDLCARFKADNLLLVLGEYIWQREVIPPEAQWGWAVENTQALADYGAEQGIEIALELEPFRLSLLNNLKEMVFELSEEESPLANSIKMEVLQGFLHKQFNMLGLVDLIDPKAKLVEPEPEPEEEEEEDE